MYQKADEIIWNLLFDTFLNYFKITFILKMLQI